MVVGDFPPDALIPTCATIVQLYAHQAYLIYNKGAVSERKCDAMTTVDLNVKLQLPEDVERKAREAGLFTGEKIGELITAEIERQRKDAGTAAANSRRCRLLFGKNTAICRMMKLRQ